MPAQNDKLRLRLEGRAPPRPLLSRSKNRPRRSSALPRILGWSDSWLPGFRLKPGSVGAEIGAGNFFIAPLDEVPPLTRRVTKCASSRFPAAHCRLSESEPPESAWWSNGLSVAASVSEWRRAIPMGDDCGVATRAFSRPHASQTRKGIDQARRDAAKGTRP